jgi:type I restriction enzyme R subunit
LGADRCHAHDEAVADGAVVPLLYEGRLVEQQIAGKVIDTWLSGVSTYGTKLAI